MKKTTSFILGMAAGMAVLCAYDKYGDKMMYDIKKSVKKMKKDAEKSIEDMM